MIEAAFDIWVDGAYFPQKDRMGGGYIVVRPNGRTLSKSFRLSAEGYPASVEAAEYMAAIKALEAQSPHIFFEVYCDNRQVVEDINNAKAGIVTDGKNKELRSLLRDIAGNRQVKAYPVSAHHTYMPDAHDLAQAGALSSKL